MRTRLGLSSLALVVWSLIGCSQKSETAPPPPPVAKDAQQSVEDAAAILKAVNESLKSSGPLPQGVNAGVTQVGPNRVKTYADVSSSSVWKEGIAHCTFGEKKLAIDFAKGEVQIDGKDKVSIPASTKEVEVRFVAGKLSLAADGAAVSLPNAVK